MDTFQRMFRCHTAGGGGGGGDPGELARLADELVLNAIWSMGGGGRADPDHIFRTLMRNWNAQEPHPAGALLEAASRPPKNGHTAVLFAIIDADLRLSGAARTLGRDGEHGPVWISGVLASFKVEWKDSRRLLEFLDRPELMAALGMRSGTQQLCVDGPGTITNACCRSFLGVLLWGTADFREDCSEHMFAGVDLEQEPWCLDHWKRQTPPYQDGVRPPDMTMSVVDLLLANRFFMDRWLAPPLFPMRDGRALVGTNVRLRLLNVLYDRSCGTRELRPIGKGLGLLQDGRLFAGDDSSAIPPEPEEPDEELDRMVGGDPNYIFIPEMFNEIFRWPSVYGPLIYYPLFRRPDTDDHRPVTLWQQLHRISDIDKLRVRKGSWATAAAWLDPLVVRAIARTLMLWAGRLRELPRVADAVGVPLVVLVAHGIMPAWLGSDPDRWQCPVERQALDVLVLVATATTAGLPEGIPRTAYERWAEQIHRADPRSFDTATPSGGQAPGRWLLLQGCWGD